MYYLALRCYSEYVVVEDVASHHVKSIPAPRFNSHPNFDPAHTSHAGAPSYTCAMQCLTRESITSDMSGCNPMGADITYFTSGCAAAASSTSAGISSCQCLPGDKKNGATTTNVAPLSTHLPNASAIVGGANSMCAASTTARPVAAAYSSANRSSCSFDAARLDP